MVEQRPEEGTAKELLEQIKTEKEQLIKDKKIKKEKPLPEITEEEIPFEIPESWEWVRLNDICTKLVDGDHNPPKGVEEITKYIMASSTNINYDTIVELEKVRYLTQDIFEKENERTNVQEGDIFFTSVGTLGRSCVYKGGYNICFQRSVSVIRTLIFNYYLKYMFDSTYFQYKVNREATGTAQKGFYLNQLAMSLVPIPPLVEQKRIVAKIEEILPYIEQYDKAYTKLETFNKKFSEDIKKSILQFAMQGKLVEQRSEEGTAEELYKQIVSEKERLIKEGKIKKEKPLDEITIDEIPFEIPKNWKWVRLNELAVFYGGYAYKSNRYVPFTNNQIIRLGNVKNDKIVLSTNPVYIDEKYALETEKYKVLLGDILFTMTGTRGKRDYFYSLLISENDLNNVTLYLNQRVGCLRCLSTIDKYWLCMILKSEVILKQVFENETGTANQGNISSDTTMSILIPLPPLAEQKRIVAKLEHLLSYCDKLLK